MPEHNQPSPERAEPSDLGPTAAAESYETEPASDSDLPLRTMFKERRIAIETMERPVRIAAAVPAATILACALLLALRRPGLGVIQLGPDSVMATPLFLGVLAVTSMSLGYLFSATTATRLWLGIPAVLVLMFIVGGDSGLLTTYLPQVPLETLRPWATWGAAATFLALAVTWVVGRLAYQRHRRLPLSVIAGSSGLFLIYLILLWKGNAVHRGGDDAQPIGLMLRDFSLIAVPVIVFAVAEFGLWGSAVASRTTVLAGRVRPGSGWLVALLLAAATAAYGCVRIAESARSAHAALTQITWGLVLGALALALPIVLLRGARWRLRWWPSRMSVFVLVGTLAAAYICLPPLLDRLPGFGVAPLPPVTAAYQFAPGADVSIVRGGLGAATFSVQVPEGWVVVHQDGAVLVGQGKGHGDEVTAQLGTVRPSEIAAVLKAWGVTKLGPVSFPGWAGTRVRSRRAGLLGGIGYFWTRPYAAAPDSLSYYLLEASRGPDFPFSSTRSTFLAMAASFRPAGQRPTPLPIRGDTVPPGRLRDNKPVVLVTLIAILVGFALYGLAIVRSRRRWHPHLALIGVLLTTWGGFLFFARSRTLAEQFTGRVSQLPQLSGAGIPLAIGVFGILALAVAASAGRRVSVRAQQFLIDVTSIVGLVLAVVGIAALLHSATRASAASGWAAVVLLVAIGWEILMSGESMTNRHTSAFPRSARVAAFFGYMLALTATVMYFSGQQAVAGHSVPVAPGPEEIQASSLIPIVLPGLLFLFLLRSRQAERLKLRATAPSPPAVSA